MGFVIEAGFFFCTVRRNDFASRSSFNFLAEQGPRNVHGKANAARQDVIRDALPPTPIPPANRPTNPSAPQRNRTRGQISPPFLRPRIYRRRNTCTDIEPIEDVPRVDFRWNRDEIETFSKNLRKEFDSGGRKKFASKIEDVNDENILSRIQLALLAKNSYEGVPWKISKQQNASVHLWSCLPNRSRERKRHESIKKNKRNVSFRPTEMIETRFPPNALPPTLPPSIVFETRARVALFNSCIIRSSRQIERIEASKAQLV